MVEKITEIIHIPSPIKDRAYVRGINENGKVISEELDPNDDSPSRNKSIIFAVGKEVPYVEVNTDFRAFVLAEREKIVDTLI